MVAFWAGIEMVIANYQHIADGYYCFFPVAGGTAENAGRGQNMVFITFYRFPYLSWLDEALS